MKKVYLICTLTIFLCIAAGISFFLIRDAHAKIPNDAAFINQNGGSYKFGKDKTKLKLVEFVYTHCPNVCPTTTLKMTGLQQELMKTGVFGKQIEFVTITIDPYRDTPEVLMKYMDGFGIKNNDGWQFLTGQRNTIKNAEKNLRKVTDALQFQFKDPGNGQFVHTTFAYLVNQDNQFVAKFPMGRDFNPKKVYEEIMNKIKN